MLSITVIKTPTRIFINKVYNYEKMLFDGKEARKTFNSEWLELDEIPTVIEKFVKHPNTNYRYELINSQLKSDIIKESFKRSDVAYYDEDDYCWIWKDEYATLESLYKLVFDEHPETLENVEFEIENIIEIKEEILQNKISYKVKDRIITNNNVNFQTIDTIIFPNVLLETRSCAFTSKQMYQIIREYVKNNINPKYARVSSDYDFCFSVVKKIKLYKPDEYLANVNLFSKKKPKYEKRYNNERDVQIFEMTHTDVNYKGYTPISGIAGDNIDDLKNKVDTYLKNLIDFINEPLIDCPHCQGRGVIVEIKEAPKLDNN